MSTEDNLHFDRSAPAGRRAAWASIARQPLVFGAATIGSTIALLLALVGVGLSAASDEILRSFRTSTEVVVVVKPGASDEQIDSLRRAVEGHGGVAAVRLTTRTETMKAISVESDLRLDPGPTLLRVRAGTDASDLASWVAGMRQALTTSAIVESVRVDDAWVVAVDGWTARWTRVKRGSSAAVSLVLALLVSTIWFPATRALSVDTAGAGAYIGLAGSGLACAVCAVLWLLSNWIAPRLTRISLAGEAGMNALFILGFVVVCAVATSATARRT